MKRFAFIVTLCFSAVLLAQAGEMVFTQFHHRNGEISSEGYLRNGRPDGFWRTFDEQGNLVSEGNRKNFLLDGVWRFYTNGILTSTITYQAGQRQGLTTIISANETTLIPFENDVISGMREVFYASGNIKQRTPFEAGMEHGIAFDFSEQGDITGITEFRRGFVVSRRRINRRDSDGLRQGLWKTFHPNLVVETEGTFLNDKKNGFWMFYDSLGNLTAVKQFVNDQVEQSTADLTVGHVETLVEHHPSGAPKLSVTFRNGVPEGIAREFDESGNVTRSVIFQEGRIVAEGIVDDRGRFQDNWREFYADGTLRAEGRYRNGRRVGNWRFYFPSGSLEQRGSFNNQGNHHGEWVWYHDNGQIHVIQNFENGLKDGHFVEFAFDGETVISEGEYIDGERHGNWVIFTGTERSEGRYRNGEPHGRWRTYSTTTGRVLFEGSFVDGVPNGRHVYFQENGRILEEGNFMMGRLNGVWRKYDENGNLFVTVTYRHDDQIRFDRVRTDAHIRRRQ